MIAVRSLLTIILMTLLINSTESSSPSYHIPDNSISKIVVYKSEHKLELRCDDRLIKTYSVALGKNPVGHKQRQGDNKTPEGIYKISGKKSRSGVPNGIRTRVAALKGRCPRPLDDGDLEAGTAPGQNNCHGMSPRISEPSSCRLSKRVWIQQNRMPVRRH
jgi:hypothetical protein